MVGKIVIDSSAALAFLRLESGGKLVPPFLASGIMSVVNYAEVAQRFWRDGFDPAERLKDIVDLGLQIVPLERPAALLAAELIQTTKPFGVSLADRVCLSEAMLRRLPVLTADRPWEKLGLSLEIKQLR